MNANEVLQRGVGILRSTARIAGRVGRGIAGSAYGTAQRVRNIRQGPKPGMDDATLAHKVESEIFRAAKVPKAGVNVNVADGVVWLRGEVKRPEQIRRLETAARAVPEVRGVENLLHLPKTPAPTRADTPARQQRTRSSTRRPTPSHRSAGRVTGDRTGALSPDAEPSPAEHAAAGEGRSPAPMGSQGEVETPQPATTTDQGVEPPAPSPENGQA